MTVTPQGAAPQPVRTIVKGEGKWVDEVYTNPADSKVVRVTSYTEEQLNTMKASIEKQYNTNIKMVNDMLELLK
jgi:hypothetical protein